MNYYDENHGFSFALEKKAPYGGGAPVATRTNTVPMTGPETVAMRSVQKIVFTDIFAIRSGAAGVRVKQIGSTITNPETK